MILQKIYETIEEMRNATEYMIQAAESITKSLEEILEETRRSDLRTEALLFKGLLKDYKQLGKLYRKIRNELEEYLEIRGLL